GTGSPNRSPLARVRDRHSLPRRRAAGVADDGAAEQAASGRVASGHGVGRGCALTPHALPWFHVGYADKPGHFYQLYEVAMTATQELNHAGRYELSHLRSLEAEAI